MSSTYGSILGQAKAETPQTKPVMGREAEMVLNDAGGYTFKTTDLTALKRFLIIGAEGGYYVGKETQTLRASETIMGLIKADGPAVVRETVDVSVNGRAPKNDPAIFVLALATMVGDAQTKKMAYDAITQVCRTGTHIFQFCDTIQALDRGWSAGLRNGVGKFYTGKDADAVAYQMIKYRQRQGWTHRDVLRLAHPKAASGAMNDLFRYGVGKEVETLHPLVRAFEEVQKATTPKEVIRLVREHRLPWEALPTQFLKDADVWSALMEHCPVNALVRNLGRLTSLGLLGPLSDGAALVQKVLQGPRNLKKLHPINLLVTLKTYASGHGDKGSLVWTPNRQINSYLEEAFYASFGHVEAIGGRVLQGIDVSGSMTAPVLGSTVISSCEAASAMAMVRHRVENQCYSFGFSDTFCDLGITSRDTLQDVCRKTQMWNFGGTDCALPMTHALKHKIPVDLFEVYTDNDTWAGRSHPFQALQKYRREMGINAKMVVYGTRSSGFTICDPKDPGSLDVVGFDTSVPAVVSAWAKQ